MNLRKALYSLELANVEGKLEMTPELREKIEKSWSSDLQNRFPDGGWRTINGAKVFVNGGKVIAGLDGFNKEIDSFFDKKKDSGEKESKEKSKKEDIYPEKMLFHYNKESLLTHISTENNDYPANSKEAKRLRGLIIDPLTHNSPKDNRYIRTTSTSMVNEFSLKSEFNNKEDTNKEQPEKGKTNKGGSEVDGLSFEVSKVGSNTYLKLKHDKSGKLVMSWQAPIEKIGEFKNVLNETLSKKNWDVDEKDLKENQDKYSKLFSELSTKTFVNKQGKIEVKKEQPKEIETETETKTQSNPFNEVENTLLNNAKKHYPSINKETVKDYANKIAKFDKEDRKIQHTAEAVQYAVQTPKEWSDEIKNDDYLAVDVIKNPNHKSDGQPERLLDLNLSNDYNKEASDIKKLIDGIKEKSKKLDDSARGLLSNHVYQKKMNLTDSHKLISSIDGTDAISVAKAVQNFNKEVKETGSEKDKPVNERSTKEINEAKQRIIDSMPRPIHEMTWEEFKPYGVEMTKQYSHSQPESFYEHQAKIEHDWAIKNKKSQYAVSDKQKENVLKLAGKELNKSTDMDIRKALYTLNLANIEGKLNQEQRDQLEKSWSIDLMHQFPDGSWKTINGAKVFINGGKVVAGLDNFNGMIDNFFKEKQGKSDKKEPAKKEETKQESNKRGFDKDKYRNMESNGYKWTGHEEGIHTFVKKEDKGYLEVNVSEEQLTNGDLEFMTKNGMSLSKERQKETKEKYRKQKDKKEEPEKESNRNKDVENKKSYELTGEEYEEQRKKSFYVFNKARNIASNILNWNNGFVQKYLESIGIKPNDKGVFEDTSIKDMDGYMKFLLKNNASFFNEKDYETYKQYRDFQDRDIDPDWSNHKTKVEMAIYEGKSVPDKVLSEYPDLKLYHDEKRKRGDNEKKNQPENSKTDKGSDLTKERVKRSVENVLGTLKQEGKLTRYGFFGAGDKKVKEIIQKDSDGTYSRWHGAVGNNNYINQNKGLSEKDVETLLEQQYTRKWESTDLDEEGFEVKKEKPVSTAEAVQKFNEGNETGKQVNETGKEREESKTKRLEILKQSLIKKEKQFNDKISEHFATVKQANGQPLNDKRGGQATLNKWERQNDSIRNAQKEIEKTKNAIEKEEGKIKEVEHTNTFIPKEILSLVSGGDLVQWRKHPHTFFVPGVEKARIVWDEKRKVVAHKFAHEITTQEQRSKFVKMYNSLNAILNKSTSIDNDIQKAIVDIRLGHIKGEISSENIEKYGVETLADIFKSWSTDLMHQFPNGQWKTINGAKVFVNGGKVVAGLDGFNKEIDSFFDKKEKEGKTSQKEVLEKKMKDLTKQWKKYSDKNEMPPVELQVEMTKTQKALTLESKQNISNKNDKPKEDKKEQIPNEKGLPKPSKEEAKEIPVENEKGLSKKESTESPKGDPEKITEPKKEEKTERPMTDTEKQFLDKYKENKKVLIEANTKDVEYGRGEKMLSSITSMIENSPNKEYTEMLNAVKTAIEDKMAEPERNRETFLKASKEVEGLLKKDKKGEVTNDIDVEKVIQGDIIENFKKIQEYKKAAKSFGFRNRVVFLSPFVENIDKKYEIKIPRKEVKVKETHHEKAFENIVGKDDLRPIMNGIYHDSEGYKVAADMHKVISIKTDTGSNSGKTINPKTGEEIKGNYPNWRAVFPTNYESKTPMKLSELHSLTNEANTLRKLAGEGVTVSLSDKIPHSFNSEVINSTIDSLRKLGVEDVVIEHNDNTDRAIVIKGKSSKGEEVSALVMPINDKLRLHVK